MLPLCLECLQHLFRSPRTPPHLPAPPLSSVVTPLLLACLRVVFSFLHLSPLDLRFLLLVLSIQLHLSIHGACSTTCATSSVSPKPYVCYLLADLRFIFVFCSISTTLSTSLTSFSVFFLLVLTFVHVRPPTGGSGQYVVELGEGQTPEQLGLKATPVPELEMDEVSANPAAMFIPNHEEIKRRQGSSMSSKRTMPVGCCVCTFSHLVSE